MKKHYLLFELLELMHFYYIVIMLFEHSKLLNYLSEYALQIVFQFAFTVYVMVSVNFTSLHWDRRLLLKIE